MSLKRLSQKQLVDYIKNINVSEYAANRNYLGGSTRISEYLTRGFISLPQSKALRVLLIDEGMSDEEVEFVMVTLDLMAKDALKLTTVELHRKRDAYRMAQLTYDIYDALSPMYIGANRKRINRYSFKTHIKYPFLLILEIRPNYLSRV